MIEFWWDGCCEPKNPGGHASYGIHVVRGSEVLLSEGKYVGHGEGISNIVAEYRGFLAALAFLRAQNLHRETIVGQGDLLMISKQMNREWKIVKGFYVPLAHKALRALEHFPKITLGWVPREQNEICDKLSKDVLKKMGVKFRIQPEPLPEIADGLQEKITTA